LWAVSRYIEQNPVRAGMIKKAEEYFYSSARAHINGTADDVLGEVLFSEKERKEYIQLLSEKMPAKEMDNVRDHTRTGRPLGRESFLGAVERALKRSFGSRPRGRPRKNKD